MAIRGSTTATTNEEPRISLHYNVYVELLMMTFLSWWFHLFLYIFVKYPSPSKNDVTTTTMRSSLLLCVIKGSELNNLYYSYWKPSLLCNKNKQAIESCRWKLMAAAIHIWQFLELINKTVIIKRYSKIIMPILITKHCKLLPRIFYPQYCVL